MALLVVRRRRRLSPKLREIARERGMPPAQVVADAIASTSTFREAAERLGVSRNTLRQWREDTGVELA